MGRYYKGDIQGKFWVGVQSSDDASFFGGSECEPAVLDYYFNEDDVEDIKAGILKCEIELGDDEKKIDEFFKDKLGYNDDMFLKELGWDRDKVRNKLEWYARLTLGRKILKQVEDAGYCEFQAEL